jgi:hypothetical protein
MRFDFFDFTSSRKRLTMTTSSRKKMWLALSYLACFLTVAGLTMGGYFVLDSFHSPVEKTDPPSPMMSTPFIWPGIRQPPTVAAQDAHLKDDDEVIGLEVEGKHRAYLVRAFARPTRHVVNDLIGQIPITVTHCDMNGCTTVFTGSEKGKALSISQTGIVKGKLLLQVDGAYVFQDGKTVSGGGGNIPYQEHRFERTTWKAWKTAYPDTDVYLGPKEGENLGPSR